jgi:predicted ester cyclase
MRGYAQFGGYVDTVTGALGDYTSNILDMVEERNKVYAKPRYHGFHRGQLLGHQPTGRRIWWYGTLFFTFEGERVRELWALSDVLGPIEKLQ